MDQDPAGEGDEAGSEETGDAVTVDEAVAGYGKTRWPESAGAIQ